MTAAKRRLVDRLRPPGPDLPRPEGVGRRPRCGCRHGHRRHVDLVRDPGAVDRAAHGAPRRPHRPPADQRQLHGHHRLAGSQTITSAAHGDTGVVLTGPGRSPHSGTNTSSPAPPPTPVLSAPRYPSSPTDRQLAMFPLDLWLPPRTRAGNRLPALDDRQPRRADHRRARLLRPAGTRSSGGRARRRRRPGRLGVRQGGALRPNQGVVAAAPGQHHRAGRG